MKTIVLKSNLDEESMSWLMLLSEMSGAVVTEEPIEGASRSITIEKEKFTEEDVNKCLPDLCYGWSNVCEAVVGAAAEHWNAVCHQRVQHGHDISPAEHELWEMASELEYRIKNQATGGVLASLTDAIAESLLEEPKEEGE